MKSSALSTNNLFLRVSGKEKIFFAKRLAFLVRAGVPILEGLTILRAQAKSRSKKIILDQIIKDVSNGQYLHISLGKFRKIYGDFAINVIRVGEMSGVLDENLNYLAEELKKRRLMKRKVLGALVYPAIIVLATFLITGMLMVVVFPKILPIFQSLNVKLPFTTLALIAISNFLKVYGLWVLLAVLLLPFLIMFLRRNKKIAYALDYSILYMPVAGNIAQNYELANLCRTLGLLLRSDVKVVDALNIAAETTGGRPYAFALKELSQHVMRGEKIALHLGKFTSLFPDLMVQMIGIGESTGRLSETLIYMADLYEDEVVEIVKNLSSVLEPILMVIMGVIVGFVAISIITPIYQVTQNIHP